MSSGTSSDGGCSIRRYNYTTSEWAPITDTSSNRFALPGDNITLRLYCDQGTITDIQWSIPGKIFAEFLTYATSVAELSPVTIFNETTMGFYWADSSDDRVVTVSFKLNGESHQLSARLHVKPPEVIHAQGFDPPPIGSMKCTFHNQLEVWGVMLRDSHPTEPSAGIYWMAQVNIPAGFGFPQGQWQYAQRLRKHSFLRPVELQNCTEYITEIEDVNGQEEKWELDTDEPGVDWEYAGPFNTGSGNQHTNDSPFSPLLQQANYSKFVWSFEMYVMFKSGVSHSQWVPLQKMEWSIWACSEKDAQGDCGPAGHKWTIAEKGQQVAGPWSPTSDHPTWYKHAKTPLKEEELILDVQCPACTSE